MFMFELNFARSRLTLLLTFGSLEFEFFLCILNSTDEVEELSSLNNLRAFLIPIIYWLLVEGLFRQLGKRPVGEYPSGVNSLFLVGFDISEFLDDFFLCGVNPLLN